jgi:hypothetical protein
MKAFFTAVLLTASLCARSQALPSATPTKPVEIMLLGSTHFGQTGFYRDSPNADLFTEHRRAEVAEVNGQLQKFRPDLILIEREPEEQSTVDSLYTLFRAGRLQLSDLPEGRGRAEQYQFGFRLAKILNLNRVFGVDFYNGTSTRILTFGQNSELYLNAIGAFANKGREIEAQFKTGGLSVRDFLKILNSPELLRLTYQTLFVTPARVRNGRFTNPDASIDTTRINPRYIGAEFISHFYDRELKIYSNIVTTQLREKSQRVLVIMGQRHAAALTTIFANDPAYRIVPVSAYLK